MKHQFSMALKLNIRKNYDYAYAKGAHGYSGSVTEYDPLDFFVYQLQSEPFKTFMVLDRHGFNATLNQLNRYDIPYTPEQKRRAKIRYEVTEQMDKQRSDAVNRYIDGSLSGTGIVKLTENFLLTTQDTLDVARFIKHLPKNKTTDNTFYKNKANRLILDSKEQTKAVENSLSNHISCLIGGAGTGKSFVTAEIVNQLRLNDKTVAILAPTHKAKAALQGKLTGGEVRTIHSFIYNPTECDVIVVDEAGMFSTPLFNQLRKVYKGQQLVFIGDKNQLPPIQYGRPFEVIQDHVQTVELRDNKRSEARDIISLGKQLLGIPQNANMTPENIHVVSSAEQAHKQGAEVILSYTNAHVKAINEKRRIKQGTPTMSDMFKIGEKIIAKTSYKNKFYNGQLFEVVGYDRIRDINTGQSITLSSVKEFEYNFEYAYALTIHKSQGSEWDVVGYLPSEHDTMNLAYVAVTRAKKKLIIINGLNESYPADRKWRHLHEDYQV